MEKWLNFKVNLQNVAYSNESSLKIRFPHSSKFDKFYFWISRKFVKNGTHSYELIICIPSSFKAKAQKRECVNNKFKIVSEKYLTAQDLCDSFGGFKEVAHLKPRDIEEKEVIIKHIPEKLDPVSLSADPDLLR